MSLTTAFACAMLKARKEMGYTQSQAAEAVSVSVRWYQKIETGERLPGAAATIRIILFLHLDVEDFRPHVELLTPVAPIQRSLFRGKGGI